MRGSSFASKLLSKTLYRKLLFDTSLQKGKELKRQRRTSYNATPPSTTEMKNIKARHKTHLPTIAPLPISGVTQQMITFFNFIDASAFFFQYKKVAEHIECRPGGKVA